jgi:hypothetical protein
MTPGEVFFSYFLDIALASALIYVTLTIIRMRDFFKLKNNEIGDFSRNETASYGLINVFAIPISLIVFIFTFAIYVAKDSTFQIKEYWGILFFVDFVLLIYGINLVVNVENEFSLRKSLFYMKNNYNFDYERLYCLCKNNNLRIFPIEQFIQNLNDTKKKNANFSADAEKSKKDFDENLEKIHENILVMFENHFKNKIEIEKTDKFLKIWTDTNAVRAGERSMNFL